MIIQPATELSRINYGKHRTFIEGIVGQTLETRSIGAEVTIGDDPISVRVALRPIKYGFHLTAVGTTYRYKTLCKRSWQIRRGTSELITKTSDKTLLSLSRLLRCLSMLKNRCKKSCSKFESHVVRCCGYIFGETISFVSTFGRSNFVGKPNPHSELLIISGLCVTTKYTQFSPCRFLCP